ncbi:transcriptional regulator [Streptomyces katrae]|uniref:Transcriptional regulator n=1 Tax=Streptomyces katrae TaxID=68223 RepID=A0A0F4K1K0_9ACTN|nr:transcriptional regulator [Streptomyces katrae]
MAISVIVGGSRVLFLEALVEALRSAGDIEVIAAETDPQHVLSLVHRHSPDVVLLEDTPVGDDVLRLASAVRARVPACGIVLMMAGNRPAAVGRAMAAGVHGIVPTDTGLPRLIATLKGVAAGCVTMAPSLASSAMGLGIPGAGPGTKLSTRESQVLRLTAGGATVKEIAAELYLAAGTVRNVTSASIKKLGGRNRFDAARIAVEQGWI